MNELVAVMGGAVAGILLKISADRLIIHLSKKKYSNNNYVFSVIFTIILTILPIYMWEVSFKAFAAMVFFYGLIVLTLVDIKLQLLPNIITYPLIVLGIGCNSLGIFTDLESALIGAFAGYFSLWAVNMIFYLVRKKQGMGYGDFKLFSAIGAWVGWQLLPLVILLSSVVGVLCVIILAGLSRKKVAQRIPFGPYLAGAGTIAVLCGNEIVTWYLGLLV